MLTLLSFLQLSAQLNFCFSTSCPCLIPTFCDVEPHTTQPPCHDRPLDKRVIQVTSGHSLPIPIPHFRRSFSSTGQGVRGLVEFHSGDRKRMTEDTLKKF